MFPLQVGEALPTMVLPAVTREGIARYAEASGDRNPIHLRDEAARAAGLPGIIQHGMLTMAGVARVFSPFFDEGWLEHLGLRFRGMVFPGDVLRVTARVKEVSGSQGRETVTLRLQVEEGDGRNVATGTAVFRRRAEPDALPPGQHALDTLEGAGDDSRGR